MTPAAIVDELTNRGVSLDVADGKLRAKPRSAIPPMLEAALRRHASAVAAVVRRRPPVESATQSSGDRLPIAFWTVGIESAPWIVSSASGGEMRLVVDAAPPWPDLVFRAAALVDVLDDGTRRADRAEAQDIADRLEAALVVLRAEGINAWLTS